MSGFLPQALEVGTEGSVHQLVLTREPEVLLAQMEEARLLFELVLHSAGRPARGVAARVSPTTAAMT